MAKISYIVTRAGDTWRVTRNGEPLMDYASLGAAFESSCANAGGDLRSGHDVIIEAATATDPRGATDLGGVPQRGDGFS